MDFDHNNHSHHNNNDFVNNDFGNNDQGPNPMGFMMGMMLLNQMQRNRQARGNNNDWTGSEGQLKDLAKGTVILVCVVAVIFGAGTFANSVILPKVSSHTMMQVVLLFGWSVALVGVLAILLIKLANRIAPGPPSHRQVEDAEAKRQDLTN